MIVLKYINTFSTFILPTSRSTQYTRAFFPSYDSKNKTTMALAKLVQSLHGFGWTNVVENYIHYFGYWPMHLLVSQPCLFQFLMQISKLSLFLFGL